MIIVNDLQDATMMKDKLSRIIRNSVNCDKSSKDILVELMFLVEDLSENIDRIDRMNSKILVESSREI
jgi:hypothetical protein